VGVARLWGVARAVWRARNRRRGAKPVPWVGALSQAAFASFASVVYPRERRVRGLRSSIQESTTLRRLHIASRGTNACPAREGFIAKDFDASNCITSVDGNAVVARFCRR
jgi:hypothetical protein